MALQKYEGPDLFQSLEVPTEVIRIIWGLLPLVQQQDKEGEKKGHLYAEHPSPDMSSFLQRGSR